MFADEGMPPGDARIAAESLVRADMRGVRTHGVRLVPDYLRSMRAGGIRARASPRVVTETECAAVIDGDSGMGSVVAHAATRQAIDKARGKDGGLGMVLVRNSNHFGAAGQYALTCAEAGVIGVAMSNTEPAMAAPETGTRSIGNAPIAFGAPDPDGFGPVVLDIACSRVAASHVILAAARGERIPATWLLDSAGRPTTDPSDYVPEGDIAAGGALQPMGGHKGYGLAIFVEVLTGVLSGAAVASDVPSWSTTWNPEPGLLGHAVIAISIEQFLPRHEFDVRLARLRASLRESSSGSEGAARLPGERAHECESTARSAGLELDALVWAELEAVETTDQRRAQLERLGAERQ